MAFLARMKAFDVRAHKSTTTTVIYQYKHFIPSRDALLPCLLDNLGEKHFDTATNPSSSYVSLLRANVNSPRESMHHASSDCEDTIDKAMRSLCCT